MQGCCSREVSMLQVMKKRTKNQGVVYRHSDLSCLKKNLDIAAGVAGQSSEPYTIPCGYNVETIVMMPVNTDRSFVYWEITAELLGDFVNEIDAGNATLIMKIFHADRTKEIYAFDVSDKVGKQYVVHPASFKPLVAEIGILEGDKFTGLLKSDPLTTPLPVTKTADEEIWMKRVDNTYEIVKFSKSETIKDTNLDSILLKYYKETGDYHSYPL